MSDKVKLLIRGKAEGIILSVKDLANQILHFTNQWNLIDKLALFDA